MSAQTLVYRERRPAREPAGALVLMHGRGADEHDLEPLVGALDRGGRVAAFLPRGPLALPPGGAHWYVVHEVGYPDPATFLPTFEQLAAWVDAVLGEAALAPERLVLAGFSQGAVMAYALGLAAGRPRPAGILAFSGFLPRVDGFDLALGERVGLPVSITHGALDPIIAVEFGRDARETLAAAGLEVAYREDPVGHTISAAALAQARSVLATIVG